MSLLVIMSASTQTGKTRNECKSLVQLMHSLQTKMKTYKIGEEHYRRKKSQTCKKPHRLMKLNQVLSSNRVYPIHGPSWHRKSLCLELIFVFSLNSVTKSLHLTIVILQKK